MKSNLHCDNRNGKAGSFHLADLSIGRVLIVDHIGGLTSTKGSINGASAAAGPSAILDRNIDEGSSKGDI